MEDEVDEDGSGEIDINECSSNPCKHSSKCSDKVAAYECIVLIAELYYAKLPAYMKALYDLTLAAIQAAIAQADDEYDEVGRQAVEFWTTICDEEMKRTEEAEDGVHDETTVVHNFAKAAVGHLVPLLLEAMCKQIGRAHV